MIEWYLLVTPLAAFAVLLLFRFAGCGAFLALDDVTYGAPYKDEVLKDGPVGYWRLQETTGNTAKNEVAGSPDGTYEKAPGPLPELLPNGSPPAGVVKLDLGSPQEPRLIQDDPAALSVRFQGAWVRVPFDSKLNPPKFTLEVLVFPEFALNDPGKFYCVLESSNPGAKLGYALVAGPDPDDVNSYQWQLWVGTGADFKQLKAKKPFSHSTPQEPNPGPKIFRRPAYLSVTWDGTKAFLFVHHPERSIDHVKFELDAAPYQPITGGDLFIGAAGPGRALFGPATPAGQKLYPFSGRIASAAIYDKALAEERIASHAAAALTNDLIYPEQVKKDNPTAYWRLVEETGTTADDVMGSRDGTYAVPPNAVAADPTHRSAAVTPTPPALGQAPVLELFDNVARIVPAKSIRVQGGWVRVPSSGPLNPPEFTLEALVFPDWNLTVLGNYFCVIESSVPGQAPNGKKLGYALYAGPDDPNTPGSPYQWQVWVGTNTNSNTGKGFVRMTEKKPYKDPAKNPGPRVVAAPTYLAVTVDASQANLYTYVPGRHFDHVKFELNPAAYSPALAPNLDFSIGITGGQRVLFPPFPGAATNFKYPFSGRIEEVAVYDKALPEDRILLHAVAAFKT